VVYTKTIIHLSVGESDGYLPGAKFIHIHFNESVNNSFHLVRKHAWIFVSGHYVSYEEQTMFKDKYPIIFSLQVEAIVFIILQIFFATRTVLNINYMARKIRAF